MIMRISEDFKKNEVPADGQLKNSDCVSFKIRENADIKILFLGNSITRHGKAEQLGWFGDWGMAASCQENDYVHKLISKLEQSGKKVSYCTANLSEWERSRNMELLKTQYFPAYRFQADFIIVRIGENAELSEHISEFEICYREMVEYFSANGAKVVLSDLFWEYEPFDCFVKELAEEKGYALAQLHDLGRTEEMKAIGKYAHAGVAVHPGDKGMSKIAERIYCAMEQFIDSEERRTGEGF